MDGKKKNGSSPYSQPQNPRMTRPTDEAREEQQHNSQHRNAQQQQDEEPVASSANHPSKSRYRSKNAKPQETSGSSHTPPQATEVAVPPLKSKKAAGRARNATPNAADTQNEGTRLSRVAASHPTRKNNPQIPSYTPSEATESKELSLRDISLHSSPKGSTFSNAATQPFTDSLNSSSQSTPGAYRVAGWLGQDRSEDLDSADTDVSELSVFEKNPSASLKVAAELVEEQQDVEALRELNNDLVAQVQKKKMESTKAHGTRPFGRNPRNVAIAALCLVVVVAVVIAVVVATGGEENRETVAPTLSPSVEVLPPRPCVKNLHDTVDAYLEDPSSTSAVALEYGWPIGTWCTNGLQDFAYLFSTRRNLLAYTFNEDLSGWDMSSATSTQGMFLNASNFNQNLSLWDMSRVESTAEMFYLASSFNGDVTSWDMSKVIDMSYMFDSATVFNQNISGWDVFEAERMSGMFSDAKSFDQDLSGWTPHNARVLNEMFYGATSFSGDLCGWGEILQSRPTIIAVTDMFENSGCTLLADPDHTQNPYGPFCESCTR